MSLKINVIEQTGERTEERTRIVPAEYNEAGEIVAEEHEETYTVTVPIMEVVTRDMTPEEEQEYLSGRPEETDEQKTVDQRVAELEQALDLLLRGATDE